MVQTTPLPTLPHLPLSADAIADPGLCYHVHAATIPTNHHHYLQRSPILPSQSTLSPRSADAIAQRQRTARSAAILNRQQGSPTRGLLRHPVRARLMLSADVNDPRLLTSTTNVNTERELMS